MKSVYKHPAVQAKLRELQQTILDLTHEKPENYPQIEIFAHQVGQQLAQSVNQELTQHAAQKTPSQVTCPTCDRICNTQFTTRTITTVDGPAEITESKAFCTACRRAFFPQREPWQLDQFNYSPLVRQKLVASAASSPSFQQAATQLKIIGEIHIAPRHLNTIANRIGQEMVWQRDEEVQEYHNAPLPRLHRLPEMAIPLACVQVDGGRIRTRTGNRHGVHANQWRESKVGLLVRMTCKTHCHDPHPELPTCFAKPQLVKQLIATLHGEKQDDSEDESTTSEIQPKAKSERWQSEVRLRTCVATSVDSKSFGKILAQRADERGFYHAQAKAFLGDGQAYNWTIREKHFKGFTAIVDFVHVIEYLHKVAKRGWSEEERWSKYLHFAKQCWQGEVSKVIEELETRLEELETTLGENSAEYEEVRTVIGYLTNNKSRMNYPLYRKKGLPTTSSMVESQIKQLNRRVKGTEKFWKLDYGGEAMLELASSWLSQDNRLLNYLKNRPGNPFHRYYDHQIAS